MSHLWAGRKTRVHQSAGKTPAFFYDNICVKVYYDNGQVEVTRILSSVFNALLENVEFRKVTPADYRLFQVADLICSLKLVELKAEDHRHPLLCTI